MIPFQKHLLWLCCLIFLGGFGGARAADNPEILGTFGEWTASRLKEGGQPVCYMTLKAPSPQAPKSKTKRGDIVLMITHRPADNSTDVMSYTAGMKFKPASEAVVTVGANKFNLFTQGDTAWARDPATDHEIAAAIRNGTNLSLSGVSAKDALINDMINLKGSFAAYAAINKACGLPVPEAPKKPKPAKKTPTTPKQKTPGKTLNKTPTKKD